MLLIILFSVFGVLYAHHNEWEHHTVIDSRGIYHVSWRKDDIAEEITFLVEVKTRGWIGFGISPTGAMINSDLIIAWIDDNGKTHFHVSNQVFY